MKRQFGKFLAIMVVSPILGFYFLMVALQFLINMIDWAVHGRKWSDYLFAIADKIDLWSMQ